MPDAHSFSGPFVQVACICQTAIQDTQGSLSIIRMTDRIQVDVTDLLYQMEC